MRIVCPACEAEYEVPDTLLANGPRKVRCARCAREWEPFAPPPPIQPPPPLQPARGLACSPTTERRWEELEVVYIIINVIKKTIII